MTIQIFRKDFPQPQPVKRFINPFTDIGFKRIFGQKANKDLLLDFLNDLLEGEERIIDLKFLDKEMLRGNDHPRGVIYDVFCQTSDGKYIIFEMQMNKQRYYKERTFYYSGRAFARQGIPGNTWDFDQLAAVYSINFLNFALMGKFRSDILMMDRDTNQIFSTKLRFVFIELPSFRKTESECETNFERWIYILKHMETLQGIPFQPVKAIFERLSAVTNVESLSPEERAIYESDLKVYRDYRAQMTYAIEEGFEKGWKKGRKEGKKEASLRIAQSLKALGIEPEKIAEATGLSLGDIDQIN